MTERQLRRQNFLLFLILLVLIVNLILNLMPYIGGALILRSINTILKQIFLIQFSLFILQTHLYSQHPIYGNGVILLLIHRINDLLPFSKPKNLQISCIFPIDFLFLFDLLNQF